MGAVRRLALLAVLTTASCGSYGAEEPAIGAPDRDAGSAVDAANGDGGGDGTAPCVPRSEQVDELFASLDPTRWLASRNVANEDSPKTGSVNGEQYVYMLTSGNLGTNPRGGLWWTRQLPLDAVDVAFDLFTSCGSTNCDAKFAVVWLEPTTDAELASAVEGKAPGLPSGRSGAGVLVDLAAGNTQATGKIAVVDIDGAAVTSPMVVVASSGSSPAVANGKHRVDIRLREKEVMVRLDGAEQVKAAIARLPAEGRFGFLASRPGSGHFYVRDVKSTFYACAAP